MVHVAIPGQRDGLNQPQNTCHMHHGQLLAHGFLALCSRNEGRQQSHENRQKSFHFFSPQSGISVAVDAFYEKNSLGTLEDKVLVWRPAAPFPKVTPERL